MRLLDPLSGVPINKPKSPYFGGPQSDSVNSITSTDPNSSDYYMGPPGTPTTIPGEPVVTQTTQPINYQDIINNNPFMQQAFSLWGNPKTGELGSVGVQNLSDLQNAFRSSVIKFGGLPDFTGNSQFSGVSNYWNQFVTPEVANLARQNQFSTVNLEDRAQREAVRDAWNAMAGRGMANSGELPYLLGRQGTAAGGRLGYGTGGGKIGFGFATQRDTDTANLLQFLANAQGAFRKAEEDRLSRIYQALWDALGRTPPSVSTTTTPTSVANPVQPWDPSRPLSQFWDWLNQGANTRTDIGRGPVMEP